MPQGNFFAIGKPQFDSACELGLNSAVLFLVMACGSSRNNTSTCWSAKAATTHAGIAWRKAKAAIDLLQEHKLVDKLSSGKRPRYNLNKPADPKNLIWLPNSLILSRDDELAPIAKLRQTQSLELLRLFIELYSQQTLETRSCLLRTLEPTTFEKNMLKELGQYTLYGFKKRPCINSLDFSTLEHTTKTANDDSVYHFLEFIGIIDRGVYLAEADSATSELIHPIMDNGTTPELLDAIADFREDGYDYVIPIHKKNLNATLVDTWQLTHQPQTSRVAAEYDTHLESCERFATIYRQIYRNLVP